MIEAVDLFAGPGGWDIAAHELGIDPLGIELDDAACATRAAAGLRTVQADVSALDPCDFACELLLASPPCQAFSMAGKGAGRRALDAYGRQIADMAAGLPMEREWLDARCEDPRAHLVLEPLRWALALRPRRVALEQVEPVLPLWEATADALRAHGYRTWTGVLSAEQFGVAQTRRRAFLLASLDGPVCGPVATHQRYVAPRRREEATLGLFDAPEPERIVAAEDRELLPWVSMAQALGWGMTARPYPVIAGGTGGGPDLEKVGGSGARAQLYDEQASGRWAGVFRPSGGPTKNGNHADGEWLPEVRFRANARENAAERSVDEPAPTITGGHDHNDRQWVVDTGNTRSGTREEGRARPTDEPAPVVTSRADQLEWREEKPSYLVNTGRDWKEGGSREDAQSFDASERPASAVDGKGRWHVEYRRGGDRIDESTPVDAPAPTVTSRTDRWQIKPDVTPADAPVPTHMDVGQVGNRPRPVGEPAPTITGVEPQWVDSDEPRRPGSRAGWRRQMKPDSVVRTGSNSMVTSRENGDMLPYERPVDAPAPTVDRKTGSAWSVVAGDAERETWDERRAGAGEEWAEERPATRIFPPGHFHRHDDGPSEENAGPNGKAIRVSLAEALALQSFPPDYPVQGSKTKQFEQVGNAVPPLLAWAVLRAVLA